MFYKVSIVCKDSKIMKVFDEVLKTDFDKHKVKIVKPSLVATMSYMIVVQTND